MWSIPELNEAKRQILEVLWKESKPLKAKEIAERISELSFPATMMHLLWLKRMGFVEVAKQGYYFISELGKEALGHKFPPKELAMALLTPTSLEKAFHFFAGKGNYLGIYARNLGEFCERIKEVEIRSVEFHMLRRDFEKWFRGLGDYELAKRIGMLREKNIADEELRMAIYETARKRYEELQQALKQP